MPHTVTLADAKARLEDLIDRTRLGEEWLITNGDGKPVAKLAAAPPVGADADSSALPEANQSSLIGLMAGQIKLLPGWDDPLEEFEPYT